MKFEIPPLPYPKTALEPHISRETLEFHYEKHHRGYLAKLEKQIKDTPQARQELQELIRTSHGDVFNFAAQVWNHTFYWSSMSPDGGGKPQGRLREQLEAEFGSVERFKSELGEAAVGEFGSGWAWLVARGGDGRLAVVSSSDAENPLQGGHHPLLCIDVWEHAYYLDYKHERSRYVEAFLEHLIHWDFAAQNLEALGG
jgi:Fe-Mn family superoxide dismutase